MTFPILLAHGALGPYDEIILPVIGGAFIGMIVITWWTSRNKTPPTDAIETPADSPEDPSHYKLD